MICTLLLYLFLIFFFFFKQKTAYEMRISDWSSDVCSSDLDRLGCCEGEPLLHEMREFSGSPRRRGARSRRARGYCSAARRRCASVAMRRTATMERMTAVMKT